MQTGTTPLAKSEQAEALLPCPFCGALGHWIQIAVPHPDMPDLLTLRPAIQCTNEVCSATIAGHETAKQIIAAWNRRQAVDEENEACALIAADRAWGAADAIRMRRQEAKKSRSRE
jgi:hypothetical protein